MAKVLNSLTVRVPRCSIIEYYNGFDAKLWVDIYRFKTLAHGRREEELSPHGRKSMWRCDSRDAILLPTTILHICCLTAAYHYGCWTVNLFILKQHPLWFTSWTDSAKLDIKHVEYLSRHVTLWLDYSDKAIDRICDYYTSLNELPVRSSVEPGYLRKSLPGIFDISKQDILI